MKRKELFWMLIPCMILAGVALWMRTREAQLPQSDGRFHLVIEKVEPRPITAKDASEGYDTEIAVTLNYIGPKPDWWGKQNGGFGSADQRECLFYETENSAKGKGKPAKIAPGFKSNPTIFYWRPIWDTKINRYGVRLFLPLSKLPPRPEKTVLCFPISIESGGYPHQNLCEPMPLVFTVRQPKQVIKPASVSRIPLLEIVRAEVIKPTAATQKANGGFDTEVELELQYLGSKDDIGAATGSDSVIDENGNSITGGPGWSTGSGQSGSDQDHPVLKYQLRLSAIPKSQRKVFVRLNYSRGDHWPLTVRIPIRQDGNDLSGIVNAKPEPTK